MWVRIYISLLYIYQIACLKLLKNLVLTIEFLMEQDLSDSEIIEQVQNRVELMKPRLGGNIALMDPKSKPGFFTIKENIDSFSIGLDQSRLQSIIDKLV